MAIARAHIDSDDLTTRQRQVVRGLLGGRAPHEIAARYRVDVRTVYWHIENVYAKFECHTLGEFIARCYVHAHCCDLAVFWPRQNGVVDRGDAAQTKAEGARQQVSRAKQRKGP